MSAHLQRPVRFFAISLTLAIIGLVAMMGSRTTEAAPAGAAQNFSVYQQQCTNQGQVLVTFVWSPSGQGNQWFDITQLPNFSAFGNQGPLAPSTYYTSWTLAPNTTFYARVNTLTSSGWRTSDILQLQTQNCAGTFTAPHNVSAQVYNDFVRVSWQAGNNNLYYCVDTAFTQSDLVNFIGSWHNWGCGTTSTQIDLANLACGRDHYLRIWAAGPNTSGYSEIIHFVSQDCDVNFSPPTNPDAQVLSSTSARLSWDEGTNNSFFCVDLATSQSNLLNLTGSWFNTHCGTTATTIDVGGLQCDTTYYWRVWAAGPGTSGYSSIDQFTTDACMASLTPPTNLDTPRISTNKAQTTWDDSSPVASYYCVDYAESQSDLTTFGDTWANTCTTDTEAVLMNLSAGTQYYWRVFAYAGNAGSGYSDIETFTTQTGP